MLETILQRFNFSTHTAFEELIFEFLLYANLPFGCDGNQLN